MPDGKYRPAVVPMTISSIFKRTKDVAKVAAIKDSPQARLEITTVLW